MEEEDDSEILWDNWVQVFVSWIARFAIFQSVLVIFMLIYSIVSQSVKKACEVDTSLS